MTCEQCLGYPISLWCNIVWQWCRIRWTLSQYSVCVATGQPDTQSNIVWWWFQIRWTLTVDIHWSGHGVCVLHIGQPICSSCSKCVQQLVSNQWAIQYHCNLILSGSGVRLGGHWLNIQSVVASSQPDTQCEIVWPWCQIRQTLIECSIGVVAGLLL